jgi:hypothetical protein
MEQKEEKKLSKKEIRRRKRLSERLKKGLERFYKKRRREKEKRLLKENIKKEKNRIKKKLAREKKKEKNKGKRKVGRPRKPGPKINYYKRNKKKNRPKQKTERKPLIEFKYKIVSCLNGNQNKFIGSYRTSEDAYEVFDELKKQNGNIIFPTLMRGDEYLENSIDEYILIEKNDFDNIKLRNEYGKLVEQKTNIDGWNIIDKFRYQIEETFWVYGYDNRSERKTFLWIYENLINSITDYLYDYKRILTYKNKIVIKHDNGSIDLIFTKSPSDAIRFYNKVEEWVKRDKIKQILFIGDYSILSDKRRNLEQELIDLTGWSKQKIQMKGTTYYMTNKNKKD